MKISQNSIPSYPLWVLKTMHDAGFEAFLVGGCVRDLFLGRDAKDWDITTNALPEQIISLFEGKGMKTIYENPFGTVEVLDKERRDRGENIFSVEITPYRRESVYSDKRHPDSVSFSQHIEDDLQRRDFTVNAMAYDPHRDTLVDLYGGQEDLRKRIIRTVGDPSERFLEDVLRILRAVRFSAQLGFFIEEKTAEALRKFSSQLPHISQERIRDEFTKLVDAEHAKDGMEMLRAFGLLEHIVPELLESVGVKQGGIHRFDVWTHLVKSLEFATQEKYPLHVKFAALFHDIGKPASRRPAQGKGTKEWTFYGHEVIGAKMTDRILKRLRYSNEFREKVVKLVRYHMFFSDPESITLSAVRRLLRNVGEELIWDLIRLRKCDRIGTGRPKAEPYRLRKYEAMIEQVLRDPISVKMLKINGDIMLGEMGMKPGPRIGWILHALLEEVLDDPEKNTPEYLKQRTRALDALNDEQLRELGEAGKRKERELEEEELRKLNRKYHV